MSRLAILGGKPVRQNPMVQWPMFDQSEKTALLEVLDSGVWGGYSEKLGEFERAFSSFHQTSLGIATANGTVSLEVALQAAGIGAGDEVIVPPISFIATATAVLRLGAVPVFVDIDEKNYNLDSARIGEALSERTRAIIPVHFAGHPAEMDRILEIAQRHSLTVIEDCAHAHGASWNGRKVGSFGQFGSFSFQQSKNMTAGEGGILITRDESLAEKARSLCNQGRRTGGDWYEHAILGSNYRMTGFQAALLMVQLSRLPKQLALRAANATLMTAELEKMEVVSPPWIDERVTGHSFYLYMIRINRDRFPRLTKQKVVKALLAEGIPCAEGYPYPLFENPVFKAYPHRRTDCPVAERMCQEIFWVSHEVLLSPRKDLDEFFAAVSKIQEGAFELAKAEID